MILRSRNIISNLGIYGDWSSGLGSRCIGRSYRTWARGSPFMLMVFSTVRCASWNFLFQIILTKWLKYKNNFYPHDNTFLKNENNNYTVQNSPLVSKERLAGRSSLIGDIWNLLDSVEAED